MSRALYLCSSPIAAPPVVLRAEPEVREVQAKMRWGGRAEREGGREGGRREGG